MKARGLLFGLNYAHTATAKLNGCINDVKNTAAYLKAQFNIPCETYTDDIDRQNTSAQGIIGKLYEMAVLSYKEKLDFVWIHYSGHGSYVKDTSGDELDGKDECLVPSDFQRSGLIPDDYINRLFSLFNPNTRVLFVFDCCHSGTIGDIKYSWEGPLKAVVENIACKTECRAITISGCLDSQVSMDAYNVSGDNQFTGALTSCLLKVLKDDPSLTKNVFTLMEKLRLQLSSSGFEQVTKLCSSYNLTKDTSLMPI